MALQQEVWVRDIQEVLFQGSEFVNNSVNHDAFIVNTTVHVPQSGANPAVVKNRAVFPATITERTDTELTYPVDSFSTDPIRVRDFEDLQLSYAKRQSVMSQHIGTLNDRMGTETAFNWAPEGDNVKVILTTGGAATSTGPDGVTARQAITKEDFFAAKRKLDVDNVPAENRFALMPHELYEELFSQDELVRKDFMNTANLPTGVIDRIAGFNIMTRTTVVNYDISVPTAPTKEAVGAAPGVDSSFGVLLWHSAYVSKALGATTMFLSEGEAAHYGDIMSAEIALGSSNLRNDARQVGTVAIAQSA